LSLKHHSTRSFVRLRSDGWMNGIPDVFVTDNGNGVATLYRCLFTVNGSVTTGTFYGTATFATVCRDPETCTDEAETNIKGGMEKLAILLGILLGFEVVYTWALFQFKSYHYLDFADLDKCSMYLVLMVKTTPSILQLAWVFHLILLLNLLYVYFSHKDSCVCTTSYRTHYINSNSSLSLCTLLLISDINNHLNSRVHYVQIMVNICYMIIL
jgi:hypothetical protein